MVQDNSSIFISYSSADFRFVDRLDADLQARGFQTWVDRRRLVVGQPWREEIAAAIEKCQLFLLVLTPTAVNDSSYVRQEVETARQHGKTIRYLTLVKLDNYQLRPAWLESIAQQTQFADFSNLDAYDVSLNQLCYALEDPTLPLSTDYDALFRLAMSLHATDPERAAIILHYIVDTHHGLYGGQVKDDLATLEAQLYPSRVARLRAQAEVAHKQGEYGVEARSLEILLSLGDGDAEAVAWANEFLPVAQQNREMLGYYVAIQQLINDGDTTQVGVRLQNLYKRAPYFGDPAGIASRLGVELPQTYLHDRIVTETNLFGKACNLLREEITSTQNVHSQLQELTYDLPGATTHVDSMVTGWAEYRRLKADSRFMREKERERIKGAILGLFEEPIGPLFVALEAGALVVGFIMSNQSPPKGGLFSFVWVPVVLFALFFVYLSLGAMIRVAAHNHEVQQAKARAHREFEKWRQLAEQVHVERLATMRRLHGAV